MERSGGEYPDDWSELARSLKQKWGWCCERCGHENDFDSGHVLTVHHLLPDKGNCEEWNLAVLCQRCHLSVQARVNMFFEVDQGFLFFVPGWLYWHVEGFRRWLDEGVGGTDGERKR